MAVEFDLGNGMTVIAQNNAQIINTSRGLLRADEVQQGDRIEHIHGSPSCEVISPPTVT